MSDQEQGDRQLFDEWPEAYNQWFATPIGRLVKKYEQEMLLDMLRPAAGELLLDVGCGTGVFTGEIISTGAAVVGLDISRPMLGAARAKLAVDGRFNAVAGEMCRLPFGDGIFDKVYSMTAIEFVADPDLALAEFDRVTAVGGTVVVTTLNSLSPWARRRKKKADQGHSLFQNMTFRSPDDLRRLVPQAREIRTAIHFNKDDDPHEAVTIEERGKKDQRDTGACVAVSWVKK